MIKFMFNTVSTPYICWEFGEISPNYSKICFLHTNRPEMTSCLAEVCNFKVILEQSNQLNLRETFNKELYGRPI